MTGGRRPRGGAVSSDRWPGVTIYLMHYWAPSKGARVIVARQDRHIVSSASGEGMTVDDPEIRGFLAWAREYYDGATFLEVARETEPAS